MTDSAHSGNGLYPRKMRQLFSQLNGHLRTIHPGLPWLVSTTTMPLASWHREAFSLPQNPEERPLNHLRQITPQNPGMSCRPPILSPAGYVLLFHAYPEEENMKKIIRNVLIVLVLLFVVGWVARNAIIMSAARNAIQRATGFDLEVGGVSAALLSSTFEISDLKLINPEDFPEETAIEIRRMFVGYDLKSFFTDEIHLREVILDIPRMVVVQKEDGESNLKRLSQAGQGKGEGEKKPEEKHGETPEKKAEKPAKKFRIDTLTLKLGTVEMHTYVQGQDKPRVETHDLKVDRTYTDIRDVNQMATIFAMAMVEGVGAQAFKGISKALEDNQGDLDKTGKELDKAVKNVGESLKGLFKTGK
jgi:hypothetical protein